MTRPRRSTHPSRTTAAVRTPDADSARALRLGRAVLALVVATLALLWAVPASSQGVGLQIGTHAPRDIQVEDLDGNAMDLWSVVEEGKPAVFEFWATWCEQCEALQPQLDRIQADYGDQVSVVAIAVAVSQNPRRIKRHLEDHDPGYPFVYDARGAATRAFNASTTAIIVMVDAEGRVTYSGVGTDQDLVSEVRQMLRVVESPER